jgi:nucleotide sugar dehydrogenase
MDKDIPKTKSIPYDISRKLLIGERHIGVWGTGFIGYSTMAYFANNGVKCIGYDIDIERVNEINDGDMPISYDMESWLGFGTAPLVEEGLLKATNDHDELFESNVPVHFVSVPTETDGLPWEGPLRDTVEKIADRDQAPTEEPILIIIESTLTPGMTEDVVFPTLRESSLTVGEDVLVGVAPRRDWFVSGDKKLDKLPRVFGGQDEQTSAYMASVLGIVCENLVPARDHEHAELVKSVENAYRHVGITLANQLARAYPDIDMREVLKHVATKWNIPSYFPSMGIGGYCVPVASQYVLSGTDFDDELSILQETIETDNEQPLVVADALNERGVESVGMLGLAYKGDLKVDVLSPTVPIANRLNQHGIEVKVNDPYFEDGYIEDQTGATPLEFPDGLKGLDAVLLLADHRQYDYVQHGRILDGIDKGALVLDNHRSWDDIPFGDHGIEYMYTGAKGWLAPIKSDYQPDSTIQQRQ